MKNNNAHWITIPEDSLNTANDSNDSNTKKNYHPVKNKIFWGIGFIVLIIFVSTLFAPQKIASLLQGNLFEQTGIKPLAIIPSDVAEQSDNELVQEDDVSEFSEMEEEVDDQQNQNIVQARTDAVSVQVDPVELIEETEDIEEEETSVEEVDVETDEESEIDVESEEENENSDIRQELDANRKLLEELNKQIAEFKQNEDSDVQEDEEDDDSIVQNDGIHSSADSITSSVNTTAVIGQFSSSNSTYRVNTHTVSITPAQALQQNSVSLSNQAVNSAVNSSVNTTDYSAQLNQAQGTPESGPKEGLLLALSVTFIALIIWKLKKTIRSC